MRKPTWFHNPFTFGFRDPLQHVHDGALVMVSAGVGVLLGLPFGEPSMRPLAIYFCTFGGAVWAGVRLSVLIFRDKIDNE